VRHPIYAGFMLATLGTAVMQGELHGLPALAPIVTVWGYKCRVEKVLGVRWRVRAIPPPRQGPNPVCW
jgi:protein-S-isoprenylcysteine O-methyltransferase Ste14